MNVGESEEAPLSYAQQQLWFLQKLEPELTAYNLPRVFRLAGPLEANALQRAFEAVVERHALLRTRFHERDGLVFQRVVNDAGFELQRVSLLDASPAEREARLPGLIDEVVEHVFDLERGQTLVARLIELAADEHVLALCMHHIVSDAWSTPILARDLGSAYRTALSSKGSVRLPQPSFQYLDYARQQRRWAESDALPRELAYWNGYLGESLPALALPTDSVRPAQQTFAGANCDFVLPQALAERLQRLCRAERCTPFVPLMAAWQALLARFSGQQQFGIGVPNAGRQREEVQDLLGFFVTTQVFRARVSPGLSLRQLCRQVRADALSALEHAELPFDLLLAGRAATAERSRPPLFQVMFGLQMLDGPERLELEGLTVSCVDQATHSAKYDLSLDFAVSRNGANGRLEYNTDLFTARTAQRLVASYVAVLERLVADPETRVVDIELLSDAERRQLGAWGTNERREPQRPLVAQQFEEQVRKQPHAVALLFAAEQLTYAELNERANRLAHHLVALGVRPESRVGVSLQRSVSMVVALLAILKAGAAYVPLDPNYPAERLSYMLEDSGIELLLKDAAVAAEAAQTLLLDALDLTRESTQDLAVEVHEQNLAYVIYTSGSTGKPKGIGITQGSFAEHVRIGATMFGLTASDRVLQFSTINFDASVEQLFCPLVSGAAVVLRGPEVWDCERFYSELLEKRITVTDLPTAYWQTLSQEFARAPRGDYGAWRQAQAMGEAMPPEALRCWRDAGLGHVRLLNTYGPTETVVTATEHDCTPYSAGGVELPKVMPIGTPLAGRNLYVLDADLNLTLPGVAGELYIGGELLARGYNERGGLTAERFVADPFEGRGGRLYRTGDLVQWTRDGVLEYLGRVDHQLKIRGFRIELGEIEAQLLALDGVREAVVVAKSSQATLVAYVSGNVEPAQLREALIQRLPEYMVPSAIVVLSALPQTPNGKVDRKALPEPALEYEAYEAPRGAAEQAVAAVWSELLGVERVGRRDNFFELGGHSLLAIQVLARLRQRGLQADVRSLFQQPALSGFAATLKLEGAGASEVPPVLIPEGCERLTPEMLPLVRLEAEHLARIESEVPGGAGNIQDIYPLAPLQEGILFHHLLQSAGDVYVTPCLLSFTSEAGLERFVAALNRAVARHDILRTAVLWEGLPEPVQVVYRRAGVEIEWLSAEALGAGDAAEALSELVHPSRYRMDVRRAPMIRALAVKDAQHERFLLQLPSHHLVLDHTTLDMLVEELSWIEQGREAELPPTQPFRNLLAHIQAGPSRAEHEAFFRGMLGDVEEPTAPFNVLDVYGDGTQVGEARLRLDAELSQRVRSEAQRRRVSAASLFHLAWALVLARTTGKDDVVFGTVLLGRLQGASGTERAFGMFMNTLPLRVKLQDSVEHGLKATHDGLAQLLEHEYASLSLAQRCSGLPGGTPLFSAMLNYRHNAPSDATAATAWAGMQVLGSREYSNYPFALSVDDFGADFGLVVEATQPAGARVVAEYVRRALEALVSALSQGAKRSLREIELVSDEERGCLLNLGENGQRAASRPLIAQQFEEQARQRPEAVAVLFESEQVSYAELNERANRLAHRLIAAGVKAESRVGIAVQRSILMVVAVLAVLKSGGAYVPLDPTYPAERLSYMLEDSGIDLLLKDDSVAVEAKCTLSLDALDLSGESKQNPVVELHEQNLAYVIYTSGSTGKPKGIGITQGTFAEHIQVALGMFGLTATDRLLQFATINFDASVEQLFCPLVVGAAMVLRGPEVWDCEKFYAELIEKRITVSDLPASYWQMLSQEFARAPRADYGAWRQAQAMGEAMPPEALKSWREAGLGHLKLLNSYGPTETVITATLHDCTPYVTGEAPVPTVMPIGGPLGGRNLYVLDADLSLTPRGVAGELYIGGELLARGYNERGALTAERFVADPFDGGGGRLYRTGDLVRWTRDGVLEYLGRVDHQVKIRGFRIELGEVEAQLLANAGVREAVVVAKPSAGAARLIGYVSGDVEPSRLREALSQTLPEYMVPSAIVVLSALPQTPNGKLDRRALPEPEFVSERGYEAPEGETELGLAAIWSELLGAARVGRRDDFFELGGHSLLAVQLVARVQTKLGLSLSVRDVFEGRDLAGVAARCGGAGLERAMSEIDSFMDSLESV
ncbi:MAG: amino acid adenylation domain-containing protein [Polyangiaceae bacterium]